MSTKEDALSRSKMSASSGARLEQIKQELARERRRITGSAVALSCDCFFAMSLAIRIRTQV